MNPNTPTPGQNEVPSPFVTVFSNGENGGVPQTSAGEDGSATPPMERDRRGRFAKGNKGGPGHPTWRPSAALRQASLEGITPETMRDIVAALIVRAVTGDIAAAKLLLAHAIGKPHTAPDSDEIDVQE